MGQTSSKDRGNLLSRGRSSFKKKLRPSRKLDTEFIRLSKTETEMDSPCESAVMVFPSRDPLTRLMLSSIDIKDRSTSDLIQRSSLSKLRLDSAENAVDADATDCKTVAHTRVSIDYEEVDNDSDPTYANVSSLNREDNDTDCYWDLTDFKVNSLNTERPVPSAEVAVFNSGPDFDHEVCEVATNEANFQNEVVRLPRDEQHTMHIEFLKLNVPASAVNVSLQISTNRNEFPPLDDQACLMHDSVVHCFPHRQIFSEPVFLAFLIPVELQSDLQTGQRSLSVYYSGTCKGELTQWRKWSASNNKIYFKSDDGSSNSAFLMSDCSEIVLALHRFCIFAVVIDGRQEQAQCATINVFVKYNPCSSQCAVDVILHVGCNEEKMKKMEQFVLQKGYRKEYMNNTLFLICSGGNLTVQLQDVDWMDDQSICGNKFTHELLNALYGITETAFRITSKRAATYLQSSFYGSFSVGQDNRLPVHVRFPSNLRELATDSQCHENRLPVSQSQDCGISTHHQSVNRHELISTDQGKTLAKSVVPERSSVSCHQSSNADSLNLNLKSDEQAIDQSYALATAKSSPSSDLPALCTEDVQEEMAFGELMNGQTKSSDKYSASGFPGNQRTVLGFEGGVARRAALADQFERYQNQ